MEGYMDIIYIKNANEYIILPHLISIITLTKGYSSMYWKKKRKEKNSCSSFFVIFQCTLNEKEFNTKWGVTLTLSNLGTTHN